MLAVVVDRVLAISLVVPYQIGKKLMLRRRRPVVVARSMAVMAPHDLLQKNQICIQLAQPVAQFVDHHAPVEQRQTLVDVIGGNTQRTKPRAVASECAAQDTASMRSSAMRASSASRAGTLIGLTT